MFSAVFAGIQATTALVSGVKTLVDLFDSDDDTESASDRRATAAQQQAQAERAAREETERRAIIVAQAAEAAAQRAKYDADMALRAAEQERLLEQQRHQQLMQAQAQRNERLIQQAKEELERARRATQEAERNGEIKARQAAADAKRAAEAKATAEAMDLRVANDNSIKREPPAAHARKHSELCAELGLDPNSQLIAHIGCTGNGKSSYINAQRGISDRHEEAAKTDHVECTMDMKAYRMPNGEYVIVDVPGCGARGFLVEEYPEKFKLVGFDYLLIFIRDGRIARDDVALAKYAVKNCIKMAFMHSKCDVPLRNEFQHCKNATERETKKQEYVKKTSKAIQTKLLSWENDGNDKIPIAGIKIRFVSATATRAVIAHALKQKYDADAFQYALPDDLHFMDIIGKNGANGAGDSIRSKITGFVAKGKVDAMRAGIYKPYS